MNTPHLPMQGKGINPESGDLLSNLGSNINLDPESLKLLEQSSLEQGVDFGKVLEATQKGQDPKAVIELLKNEKELSTKAGNELIQNGKQSNILENSQGAKISENQAELANILGKNNQLKPEMLGHSLKNVEQSQNQNSVRNHSGTGNKLDNTLGLEGKIPQVQVKGQQALQTKSNALVSQANKNQAKISNESQKGLVNLNEFISKQSPSMQANIAKKAYKPMTDSMFNKKVEAGLPEVTSIQRNQTKLQDIMFNQANAEGSMENGFEGSQFDGQTMASKNNTSNEVQPVGKVFDINSLSKLDSTNQVISKVQDYIIQTKAGNNPEVEVSFHHDELGKVDLLVQKDKGDQVRLMIGTNSKEGSHFFTQNQRELLSTLNNSGIQISDFKLESSNLNNNSNNSQDSSSREQFAKGNGQQQQHNSESGKRDQESRKRSELWEQFSKEAA